MSENANVRWKQRFSNYKKALAVLTRGVALQKERELSELERGGLIQAFEFTQELSWKVLKDFIEEKGGGEKIFGSKDAVRLSLNRGLIFSGETWMSMIDARNASSHTYDEADSIKLAQKISFEFVPCFLDLEKTLDVLV